MMEHEEAKSEPTGKPGLAKPLAKAGATAAGVFAMAALIKYLARLANSNRGIESKPPRESQATQPLDKPVGQSYRPWPPG